MTRRGWIAIGLGMLAVLTLWLTWPRAATAPLRPAPLSVLVPAAARRDVEPIRPPVRLPEAQVFDAGQPREAELRGRVVSITSGAGIPGAELSLEHLGAVTTLRTGADGLFALSTPLEGAWTVAAIVAGGFHPYAPQWGHSPFELHLERGVRVEGLRFVLTPQVDYQGQVVGPDEAPIPGAEISVLGGDRGLLGAAPKQVSDAEGRFVFQAEDGAVVLARHPRYLPGRAPVDLAVTVTHALKLRLRPLPADAGEAARGPLRGRVVDERHQPIPAALVTASAGGDAAEVEGLTDADGRFSFDAEAGEWEVTARDEGRVPATAAARVPGEAVELVLDHGGRIRGTVVDGQGLPVSAFAVAVRRKEGALARGEATVRSVIDGRGAFVLDGLAAGAWAVSAQATGFAPSAEVGAEVPPGGEVTVRIAVGRGGTVTGRVTDRSSGAPLGMARVALESETSGQSLEISGGETRTAADGTFELGAVPPRRVSLLVTAEQHHARLLSAIQVKEGETTGVGTVDLGALEAGETPRIELVGIGAILKAIDDVLRVIDTVPGGGAAEVGLRKGDDLLEIDGQSTAGLGFAGGVELIRGAENSSVHLKVRREGGVLEVDVPRRRIVAK